jgi:predicted RNA-binding Zn ribbon-like protein
MACNLSNIILQVTNTGDTMKTMTPPATAPRQFEFVAGDLCLDFTNTVGGKRGVVAREYLNSYADLVSWCAQAGIVEESEARALLRWAARRPDGSVAALRQAIALRETIYRIFAALATREPARTSDLDDLNAALGSHLGRLRVVAGKKGFAWKWAEADEALDQPLGPIARSAAGLLTSPQLLERVHQCESDTCGWLFVDSTKNHSRRWCVMKDCGNAAKVRRFRLRQRRAGANK